MLCIYILLHLYSENKMVKILQNPPERYSYTGLTKQKSEKTMNKETHQVERTPHPRG